jgi:hypothetical protein
VKGSGNKNAIQERHTILIDDNAVLVTGFYEFTRMQEGKAVPAPSRFTMLITKRGSELAYCSSPFIATRSTEAVRSPDGTAGCGTVGDNGRCQIPERFSQDRAD